MNINSKTIIALIVFASFVFSTQLEAKKNNSQKKGAKMSSQLPEAVNYSGRMFVFNPRNVSWAAYENGRKVNGGTANGGSHYCPDIRRRCHTPVGSFSVQSKGSAGCISTRYPIKKNGKRGGAHMPYCMYFTTNFAIHGYDHIGGSNVSHGCVRVSNDSARWLSSFLRVGSRVRVMPY